MSELKTILFMNFKNFLISAIALFFITSCQKNIEEITQRADTNQEKLNMTYPVKDLEEGHNDAVTWFYQQGYSMPAGYQNWNNPYINDSTLSWAEDYLVAEMGYKRSDAEAASDSLLANRPFVDFLEGCISNTITDQEVEDYYHDLVKDEGGSRFVEAYLLETHQYDTDTVSAYINYFDSYDRSNFNSVDNRIYDIHYGVLSASADVFVLDNDGTGPVPIIICPPYLVQHVDAAAALTSLVEDNDPVLAEVHSAVASFIISVIC